MRDARTCIKKDNLASNVAFSLSQLNFDNPSRDLKCLFKCLAQINGGMDESGNVNKENMLQLVENFAPELTETVS